MAHPATHCKGLPAYLPLRIFPFFSSASIQRLLECTQHVAWNLLISGSAACSRLASKHTVSFPTAVTVDVLI